MIATKEEGLYRFLCDEVFISSRRSSSRDMGISIARKFPHVPLLIFSMARAYVISSPLSRSIIISMHLFIVLLSYRFNWHVEQFYYCSHHSCSRVPNNKIACFNLIVNCIEQFIVRDSGCLTVGRMIWD